MKISDKLAEMRGGGHHVPVGLGDILEDLDKRISALEPKEDKSEPKKQFVPPEKPTPVIPIEPNPLDGTNLKS